MLQGTFPCNATGKKSSQMHYLVVNRLALTELLTAFGLERPFSDTIVVDRTKLLTPGSLHERKTQLVCGAGESGIFLVSRKTLPWHVAKTGSRFT